MLQIFAHSQSLSLVICGKTSNTIATPHLQIKFPFLVFECKCAKLSVVANVLTMFNDAILHAVTS